LKSYRTHIYSTVLLLGLVGHLALIGQAHAQGISFDDVSARSMRANLRFFASDELKGRDTPSPELDIAALWISSQFEQAGLEPVGKDGYFQVATFRDKPVKNVLGVVKGSDPKLADTYLLVSGHYDHVGVRGDSGDTIYNGANDNGSSIVAMIELAKAFGKMKTKPKRTIVFVAFWGEEKGLQGARYYAQNPAFPLAKTIGMVNMEQLGRTDDSEGPQVARFAITGYDFSDLPTTIAQKAKSVGVQVDSRPQGDPYFMASDNAALAAVGIPAHTISVAYSFPDYHKVGDHWDRIDYDNMAKVVKAIGFAVHSIAESPKEPAWNASNAKAKRYLDAWKKLKTK